MTLAHTKAHFVRAIMESVTMVLSCIIDATERLDIKVDKIVTTGGGALSPIWCQIKADVTGRPVITTVNNESSGCLGAAILAGLSSGAWPDLETACEATIRQDIVYKPNPENREVYDKTLADFKQLMGCLEPMFK